MWVVLSTLEYLQGLVTLILVYNFWQFHLKENRYKIISTIFLR